MPDLSESFQGRDLGYLRIVAELWGIDLQAPDARVASQQIVTQMLEPELVDIVVGDLPEAARAALRDLLQNGGRLSWALFTRRYGALREMGPGRRDRERPYVQSPSPAEALWYRGIISRAFFDASSGMEEFAFIPEDLLILLPSPVVTGISPLGRPASPAERAFPKNANDRILDDACTYLAAMRIGNPSGLTSQWAESGAEYYSSEALHELLGSAGLLDDQGQPAPDPARDFLAAARGDALVLLVMGWKNSRRFNELRLIPDLAFEGQAQNDPVLAREAILDFLSTLPADSWWNLASFIEAIRQQYPDFQRPAGDYDSWFVKETQSGAYLRGFEHWDEVDGALVRFLFCGPMHWLGLIDVAASSDETAAPVLAFRMSAWGKKLLKGEAPPGLQTEDQPIFARTDGVIQAARLSPRSARYQLARFCRWERFDGENYRYRLTPQSLAHAKKQGLRVSHLLTLLRRSVKNTPPNLVKALERWEEKGVEVHLQQEILLKLSNPEILQALRSSPAARFLGDPLGPAAVVVKPGTLKKVLSALAELGYLGEVDSHLVDEL